MQIQIESAKGAAQIMAQHSSIPLKAIVGFLQGNFLPVQFIHQGVELHGHTLDFVVSSQIHGPTPVSVPSARFHVLLGNADTI